MVTPPSTTSRDVPPAPRQWTLLRPQPVVTSRQLVTRPDRTAVRHAGSLRRVAAVVTARRRDARRDDGGRSPPPLPLSSPLRLPLSGVLRFSRRCSRLRSGPLGALSPNERSAREAARRRRKQWRRRVFTARRSRGSRRLIASRCPLLWAASRLLTESALLNWLRCVWSERSAGAGKQLCYL